LAPRRCRDGTYPGAVVPIMPAERSIRQLVRLSESSVAEEYYSERSGNKWISE